MGKKSEPSLDDKLKREYQQWEYYYTHGGSDPFWADGCNMDLIRNHIIYYKKQMEEAGELTDIYYRELPPEVDRDYMARADEIRANAKKSLIAYKSHPDYQYLIKAIKSLNKRQIESTCINNVIGYARGLEIYIGSDDLVSMRRHEQPERYFDSFVSCRKNVEKILGEKPRIIFYEDSKQLIGQMSIGDWLTV